MFTLAEIYRLNRKTEDLELLITVIEASHGPMDVDFPDWNEFGGEDPASFLGLE